MTWFDWATGWIKWGSATLRDHEVRLTKLEKAVKVMGDELDTIDADFKAYQALVNTTLTALNDRITSLTAGQLDPAKATAVDQEIKDAIAKLTPTPATP